MKCTFPVRLPSGTVYWTVIDDASLEVVAAADRYLRNARLGRDQAEATTRAYATGVALYLRWADQTGRDWAEAARDLGLFVTWLKFTPAVREQGQVAGGPGSEPVRGARRINAILAAVRGFLTFAVTMRDAPSWVMGVLYELADASDLPVEVRGEDGGPVLRLRPQHRLHEPHRPVDRASDVEIVALLAACRTARDRLTVLLMARAGLRRSEVAGLRRSDMHLLGDSGRLGCPVSGAHVHVERRANPNGAWAKSRRPRAVPLDFLVVRAADQYAAERGQCGPAAGSDFLLVNLSRPPLGSPLRPDAINELISALSARAGLPRQLTPHMCRHAFASNVADAGADVDVVQTLLGHASPHSARPYLHPSASRIREAVDRVPSPRAVPADEVTR